MRCPTAQTPWSRAIMQHIEEAGVHSAIAPVFLPALSPSREIIERSKNNQALGAGAEPVGPVNSSLRLRIGEIYLIETSTRVPRHPSLLPRRRTARIASIARGSWPVEKLSAFPCACHPT